MKKAKDINRSPYRARWIGKNPEALYINSGDLLKRSWKKALDTVTNDGTAIVLMHKRDMVGVIIPTSLKDKFYDNIPQADETDPRVYKKENEFKNDFEQVAHQLNSGNSVIVTDNDNNELFTIASRGFAVFLETDKTGHVDFTKNLMEEIENPDKQSDFDINKLSI